MARGKFGKLTFLIKYVHFIAIDVLVLNDYSRVY